MQQPRRRVAGLIRRPTREQLLEVGALEHLSLTPSEVEAFGSALDQVLAAVDRLDDIPPVSVRPSGSRDAGSVPDEIDDPFHAFTRRCRVNERGDGPLAGMTLAVTDSLSVAGIPITNSSRTLSFVPSTDAVVVERILAAGVTITAKTNLDDLSLPGTGLASWLGPTLNPRDLERSAGGSSGGAAAAVASGAVDASLAVDQSGSARVSASFTGLAAHKPTHGLVPVHGLAQVDTTSAAITPIAATVREVARILDVISGDSDRDPQWVRAIPEQTSATSALNESVAGLRIGLVAEALDGAPDDVRDAIDEACEALTSAGAEIVQVSVPLWTDGIAIAIALSMQGNWLGAQSDGTGYAHGGEIDVERTHAFGLTRQLEADSFPPLLKLWMIGGRYLRDNYFSAYTAKAANARRALRDSVDTALREVDLLLTPTTPRSAPRFDDIAPSDSSALAAIWTDELHTSVTSLTGHPSSVVPIPASPLSLSVQFVARPWADAVGLRAAAAVENHFAPHESVPTMSLRLVE